MPRGWPWPRTNVLIRNSMTWIQIRINSMLNTSNFISGCLMNGFCLVGIDACLARQNISFKTICGHTKPCIHVITRARTGRQLWLLTASTCQADEHRAVNRLNWVTFLSAALPASQWFQESPWRLIIYGKERVWWPTYVECHSFSISHLHVFLCL